MVRWLVSAQPDDELSAADEDAAAALASHQRGEGILSDQLRAELAFDA